MSAELLIWISPLSFWWCWKLKGGGEEVAWHLYIREGPKVIGRVCALHAKDPKINIWHLSGRLRKDSCNPVEPLPDNVDVTELRVLVHMVRNRQRKLRKLVLLLTEDNVAFWLFVCVVHSWGWYSCIEWANDCISYLLTLNWICLETAYKHLRVSGRLTQIPFIASQECKCVEPSL